MLSLRKHHVTLNFGQPYIAFIRLLLVEFIILLYSVYINTNIKQVIIMWIIRKYSIVY